MMKDFKIIRIYHSCKWKIFLKGVNMNNASLLSHFLKFTLKFSTN